jgi:hypothetical protein
MKLSRGAVETLVVTLLTAAVSALAFVAYKHPVGYRQLAVPLITVTALSALYGVVWGVGYVTSQIRSLGERLKEQPSEPLSSHDYLIRGMNAKVAWLTRIVVVSSILLAYFALLWFLPRILGIDVGRTPDGGA